MLKSTPLLQDGYTHVRGLAKPVEEVAKATDNDFVHHPLQEGDEDTDQVNMIDASVQLKKWTLAQVSPAAPVDDTLDETQQGHGKGTKKSRKTTKPESCGQAPAWNPFAQLFAQPSALSTTEPAAESA
ncbi:hypothetical protein HPB47_003301 [Ixodes persulcatus]|uniref:Uncharacterized protein n=1 Tax=Ixodes persulcatus TaxID=34615 RepID=A0AC60PJ86_IXOPE|nr:hypothetical protein HPB47_003301 [Ixodes persulcatus]